MMAQAGEHPRLGCGSAGGQLENRLAQLGNALAGDG
jgi:hypothetical protein